MNPLPLIPTSTVGSYAPPSWFCSAVAAIERGEFGPTDREETYNDACRIAMRDQEEAGLDVITEGEMRRVDFNLGFYGRLKGLQKLPPARTLG
ncbi:MAG TPA: methionine synthase, partial [Armatimonadota bacterium]|nr:methionine synthase [Armatimonadota bacterium]